MTNEKVKISQLPGTTELTGTEVFPLVKSGVTSKITASALYRAQSKLQPTVSPQDYGATGNGIADDTFALLAALQSGKMVDGLGASFAVYGQLAPTSLVGLRNATLLQKTTLISKATLSIVDISGFLLEDVTINMGTDTTVSNDDSSTQGLKITTSTVGTFNTNFKLSRVTVTGNGSGSRFYIRSNKHFTVSNCIARDCIADFVTPYPVYNDLMNGFDFNRNSNYVVEGCRAHNFKTRDGGTGAYTNYRTRGFLFTESQDFTVVGCVSSEVDQGYDFSGSIDIPTGNVFGNERFVMTGCVASDSCTFGFKFANVTKMGMIVGCTSSNPGYIGFVASAPGTALADPTLGTSNLTFSACVVTITQPPNARWPAGRNAGFRLMSTPAADTYPRNCKFIGCYVTDTNDVSTTLAGFSSDAVKVGSTMIFDIVTDCRVNNMPLTSGFSGYISGSTGSGEAVYADSPGLIGTPTAPTAPAGTNTTQIATTAHVFAERAAVATLTNKTIALGSNTVSGTLAQFNTAVTDADLVSLAGTETLTNKTLTTPVINGFTGSTAAVNIGSGQVVKDTSGNVAIGSSTPASRLHVRADVASGSAIVTIQNRSGTAPTSALAFVTGGLELADGRYACIQSGGVVSPYLSFMTSVGASPAERVRIENAGNLLPGGDNTQTNGSGAKRWSVIYAGTGTINTSDAREKTAVRALFDDEIQAAIALSKEVGVYQFLDSVAAKGDKARHHIGMTVQRAMEIMTHYGLDPFAYGFICYDKWDDKFNDVVSETGAFERSVLRQAMQAKERTQQSVELVNGVPTLVKKTELVMVPVVDMVQVVDENGKPMEVEVPAVVDRDGNETAASHLLPMLHPVPRMESVTERYDRVLVEAGGDRYSFRYDQLSLFIARGIDARLTALEQQ